MVTRGDLLDSLDDYWLIFHYAFTRLAKRPLPGPDMIVKLLEQRTLFRW
jgi:hypothetical protein